MTYSEAKSKLIEINQKLKDGNDAVNLDNIETVMEEFFNAHSIAKHRLNKFIKTKNEIIGKINE